jgi:hypothetical protein
MLLLLLFPEYIPNENNYLVVRATLQSAKLLRDTGPEPKRHYRGDQKVLSQFGTEIPP